MSDYETMRRKKDEGKVSEKLRMNRIEKTKSKTCPRFAMWLMRGFVRDVDSDFAVGDLTETYRYLVQTRGKWKAIGWLWMEMIRSLPMFLSNSIYWRFIMLKNYILIALRNIRKNKSYSIINIVGFSVGLSAAILTFLFVLDEIRVNTHFNDLDQIYCVKVKIPIEGEIRKWFGCPSAVGPYLKENYAEVLESGVMINGSNTFLLENETKKFNEAIILGHFSLFNIFSHQILKGIVPPNEDIHSIVIDDEIAAKFFGHEDPIGKTLRLDGKYDLRVAAVFKKMATNATERFKILVPFKLIDELWSPGNSRSWGNHAFRVFVKTHLNLNIDTFNPLIEDIIIENNANSESRPFLYPFKDKYLYGYGVIDNVKTYSIITVLLLIVASINYINLSSAQSVKRAREVGIRKVVGAKKKQIVSQFFFESLIITLLAVALSALFLVMAYPYWQQYNYMTLPLSGIFTDTQVSIGVFGIVLVMTVLSSIYPAYILSSFLPKKVLQGGVNMGRSGKSLRSVLVIIQFAVSVALIIITTTVYKQIQFMKNKEIGFKPDQIASVWLHGNTYTKCNLLKTELKSIPGIVDVSLSSHIPGTGGAWNSSSFTWIGKSDNFRPLINENSIDEDYLKFYNIRLIQGRVNKEDFQARGKVFINETLKNMMDKENVIGEIISHESRDQTYEIIGVLNDFHHQTARAKIDPFIFYTDMERMHYHYIGFKFQPQYLQEVLAEVEKVVTTIEPRYPFEYAFLDKEFDDWYLWEERIQFTVQSFGLVAIMVSCLGLLGMAIFSTNQRTKEIGIRKTLGAGTREIVILLLREFTKWVIIANVIAWPVAYLYLRNWISDYPYRISLGPELFLFSGFGAFILAVLTVLARTYRAAVMNPVKSLRTE